MDGLTASDVAMLNGNGGGMNGMNGAFWIFALLILANGGIGGWGNNGNNSNAIQADVNRGFDNQNLQAQTRDILAAVTSGTAQTIAASTQNASNAIAAIKDGNASLIREFGNVETALTAMSGENQKCCCEILRAIDNSNFLNAQNTAAINANMTAQTQKILDVYNQNIIQGLRDQVQALQLAQQMTGVVKYPMASTYSSGGNPFCSCANGCGC